jgi:hypothetical protein
MRKVDKVLQTVPTYPKKIRVSELAKEGLSQIEIINRAKTLGYIVDTTMSDPRISKNGEEPILIFKNQYPYKSVKSLDEASCETKVPKATILRMISDPLSGNDKRIGGKTTPDGWGFDYLA